MSARESTYDALVDEHGLSEAHRLVLAAAIAAAATDGGPAHPRVLDVGCAGGHVGAELAAAGADVVGVELDGAKARARGLEVIEGSIDDPALRARLPRGLDAIVLADVLEHLADPWETLAFLATLLRPGGRAIVSLPNVGHWTMRRNVLRGRFPLTDHGLFDRTHLRWFTRASAAELLASAGLSVAAEAFTEAPLPLEAHVRLPPWIRTAATAHWPEVFALQVVLTGVRL